MRNRVKQTLVKERESWYHLLYKVIPGRKPKDFAFFSGWDGRPCIANNPGQNADCLVQGFGNRDIEKWSSEYTQRESCTVADGLQRGWERNQGKFMCFGLGN